MKTISTLVCLLAIVSICAASAVLYLNQEYNISAVLTITWIVSLTVWIKANGFLEDKKTEAAH